MSANPNEIKGGFKLKTRAELKGSVVNYHLSDDNDEDAGRETVTADLAQLFPGYDAAPEVTKKAITAGFKTHIRGRLGSKLESLDEAYETAQGIISNLAAGQWLERAAAGEEDLILAMVQALPEYWPTVEKARAYVEEQVLSNCVANGLDVESEDEAVQEVIAKKVRKPVQAAIRNIDAVRHALATIEFQRAQSRLERAKARAASRTGTASSVLLGGISIKL